MMSIHTYLYKSVLVVFIIATFSLSLVGCSKSDGNSEIHDPLETVNRNGLKLNDALDKAVLRPVAKGYRAVTPSAGRTAVRNFLRNLNSPIVIGNEILQGDVAGAGNATMRFVVNTLAGFGGILDLAGDAGFEHQPEDFGQTLAKWGVGDGLYVMLPLLGPSSLRDASGMLVDSYADPVRIYLTNIDEKHIHYKHVGAKVISRREELLEVVDDLRKNSFDYYAAVRSAYYQRRQSLINDGNASMLDYDDF